MKKNVFLIYICLFLLFLDCTIKSQRTDGLNNECTKKFKIWLVDTISVLNNNGTNIRLKIRKDSLSI